MNPEENGQGTSRGHRPLIVGLIAAVLLVGVSAVGYTRSITKAKEATLRTNLRFLNEAMSHYRADKGRYPATLEALVQDHYLRAVPADPFTGSTGTWQTVSELGVVQIRSGSNQLASDGRRYADW
jgi:general secretion pathway protein G